MMDIDHFKLYNDHYGHQAGDDCLKQVAKALETCLRRPGDLLARYGGEEFVALLPDTDQSGAMLLANYARAGGGKIGHGPRGFTGMSEVVTVSLGVAAEVPQRGTQAAELVAAADKALYQAKKKGRNQAAAGSSVLIAAAERRRFK
jgi:diguanylate cyclase (GGDEF)-like protein